MKDVIVACNLSNVLISWTCRLPTGWQNHPARSVHNLTISRVWSWTIAKNNAILGYTKGPERFDGKIWEGLLVSIRPIDRN